jgi:glyoxylase-like metal-dependent hydrolase (beta-lactamase superfamily II)/rhodanese-related sulfurtransferase
MFFRQFYLGCLAHASYLIGSNGEAAVVDPQRDVEQYIEEAERNGLAIKYVIETHLHADFVSGHRELASRTGAEIVFGAAANAELPHRDVHDGDVLELGGIELRALETPGHTPESVCWLVVENGAPRRVLTGDTLFIGDVGRPDLAGGRGFTPQQMAAMLYDSLRNKILTLPDDVEVWPAHGAGSACGRNISSDTSSTIGIQRRTNYALAPMTRDEFVHIMTMDLPPAPPYFPIDAEINRTGAAPLNQCPSAPLGEGEVAALAAAGATLLDVRDAVSFGAAHIAGSINIGLDGQFASWCGSLLPLDRPIVIIADSRAHAAEAVMRLARVGVENVAGFLKCIETLPVDCLEQITVSELRDQHFPTLDVRRPGEYASGHVPGARNIPLNELPKRIADVPQQRPLAVICAGGYRSSAAASILAREGFRDLRNVMGGTAAWIRAGFATETQAGA